MIYPCIISFVLLGAGTAGVVQIARAVEKDSHLKDQQSAARLQVLASKKQAFEQLRINNQLADLESARLSSMEQVNVGLRTVRTVLHVK